MRNVRALCVTTFGLLAVACESKTSPPKKADPTSAAPPSASISVVNARLGCSPTKEGGHAIAGPTTRGRLSIAAARGRALVVSQDGTKAERLVLGPEATPMAAPKSLDAPLASAATFEGEIATLSLASDCRMTLDKGEGPARTLLTPASATSAAPQGSAPRAPSCERPSAFVGAGRGDLAAGVALDASGSLDALLLAPAGARAVHLDASTKLDAPAVAVGETWAAVAWRTAEGNAQAIHLARIDKDGATAGKPLVVDKGAVDAPALAFEGDTVHLVWSARQTDKSPYQLRWAKWTGKGNISDWQVLATRGGAATAPAIAIHPRGQFVLAWTEPGDKGGVVKAGSSRISVLHAVTNASEVSAPSSDARDPGVALDGSRTWVVWNEGPGTTTALRATTLRCIE